MKPDESLRLHEMKGLLFRQAEIKLLSFGLEKIFKKKNAILYSGDKCVVTGKSQKVIFFVFFLFTLLTIYGGWARGLGGRSHPPSGCTVTSTACAVGARLHALNIIFLYIPLQYVIYVSIRNSRD